VTSFDGLFRSGSLHRGGVFTFTFETPGTYAYGCDPHQQMIGRVVVTAN
jgi:plastocyanin